MPRQYEAIRNSYARRGKPMKEAKRIAAATYNKRNPKNPVTGKHKQKSGIIRKAMKY